MKDSILNNIKDFTIEAPPSIEAAILIERKSAKQLILKWIEATVGFLIHITG